MLVIQDDGRGFEPNSLSTNSGGNGLGLAGMRDRVELTRGAFSIESKLGEGTTLRACWLTQMKSQTNEIVCQLQLKSAL